MRKILIAGSGRWGGTSMVGEHHVASILRDRGWQVGFLSLPVTPFHFLRSDSGEARERLRLWRRARDGSRTEGVWAWSPLSLLHAKPAPPFRSRFVFDHWWRLAIPGMASVLSRSGFDAVDILLVREPRYGFLRSIVDHRRSAYRLADFDAAHRLSYPAERSAERDHVRSFDLVVASAPSLVEHARSMGARETLLLENGVNLRRFSGDAPPCPEDLAGIPKPRAILVGTMAWWVDMRLLQGAAKALPEVSFVLVGDGPSLGELDPAPNLHLLGGRPQPTIPAYLRHSQVGLLPFRHGEKPEFLDAVNPLKLHEYLAAGLPVVSTGWKEIRRLEAPISIARSEEDFITAVRRSVDSPSDGGARRVFAAKRDWNALVDKFLDACEAR